MEVEHKGPFRAKREYRVMELVDRKDPYSVRYRSVFKDYNMDDYFIPTMISEFHHYFPNGWINIESRWFDNVPRFSKTHKRIAFKDFLWIEFGLVSDRNLVGSKYDDPMYNNVVVIREKYANRKFRKSLLDQRFSFNHIAGGLYLNPIGEGSDRILLHKLHKSNRRPTMIPTRRHRHPHHILSTWSQMMECLWTDFIIYNEHILGKDVYPSEVFEVLNPL